MDMCNTYACIRIRVVHSVSMKSSFHSIVVFVAPCGAMDYLQTLANLADTYLTLTCVFKYFIFRYY